MSSKVPNLHEYEVFDLINQSTKPKSGVPGDLPQRLVKEFGPELSCPITMVFNTILNSSKEGIAKWPKQWKNEYGIPLAKISDPQTIDDLRIISLTSFFSKVLERFIVQNLLKYIGPKIDPKQFGGIKGSSISHYMIEMINFILYNQDFNLPIAILACAVDFSKAFNRQNHHILVTKLADMGVPGWLINVVIGFLTERNLVLKYKEAEAERKALPGGGPQGTLLGLVLFLVLINDCGFSGKVKDIGGQITQSKGKFVPSTFHAKYIDDLTLMEAINLNEALIPDQNRALPASYHDRTGHKLDPAFSQVYAQIKDTETYAELNEMKLNHSKMNFMLFNPAKKLDFTPTYDIGKSSLETAETMKILGIVLENDLSWNKNTNYIVEKAYKRLWMIKRLKYLGAKRDDLTDIYTKQIRSVLEFGVPIWNSSLTQQNSQEIERVQKTFLHILLGRDYTDYQSALKIAKLDTLEDRRLQLCKSFAIKCSKHPKFSNWFQKTESQSIVTRSKKRKYKEPLCKTARFQKSPIPYLTNLLNNM